MYLYKGLCLWSMPCRSSIFLGLGSVGAKVLFVDSLVLDIETELLLLLLKDLLELLVCPPNRLLLEETVNLLQGNTTSLRNEEEGEEEGKEGQRREEEVHAVSHSLEHLLGEARDEEVEQPVAGSCAGLSQGTEVGIEEFRVDDPGGTVPGRGVDSSPKVEEDDSGNTATVERAGGVVLRCNHVDIRANDPHADGAGDTTDKKKVPATELIDKEQQPDKRHNGLDHTKDTGHQVDSVRLNANALQKLSVYVRPRETKSEINVP